MHLNSTEQPRERHVPEAGEAEAHIKWEEEHMAKLIVVSPEVVNRGLAKMKELEEADPGWKVERERQEQEIAAEKAQRDSEHASKKSDAQQKGAQ